MLNKDTKYIWTQYNVKNSLEASSRVLLCGCRRGDQTEDEKVKEPIRADSWQEGQLKRLCRPSSLWRRQQGPDPAGSCWIPFQRLALVRLCPGSAAEAGLNKTQVTKTHSRNREQDQNHRPSTRRPGRSEADPDPPIYTQ